MERVELAPHESKAIRAVWDSKYRAPFDPALQYDVEAIYAGQATSVPELLKALRGDHIYFSVLSKSRGAVIESVKSGRFPAKQFCAITPRIALMFARGHRSMPKAGDPAPICVLRDPGAVNVGSPSVIQRGSSDKSQLSSSHHMTSNRVELVAVVQVRVAHSFASVAGVNVRRKKRKQNLFGEEVDETTKRRMRKIRRKRMDNFGIKEDF